MHFRAYIVLLSITPLITALLFPGAENDIVSQVDVQFLQSRDAKGSEGIKHSSAGCIARTFSATHSVTTSSDQKRPPSEESTHAASTATLGIASLTGSPFTLGITYTQYHADGSCRSAADVNSDIIHLVDQGYDLIRLYWGDCDGPRNVFRAIKGKNVWMFLGIKDPNQATAEAQNIALQLENDWSQVHTVSIGNEVVNAMFGQSVDAQLQSLESVMSGMTNARSVLRQHGYQGPVVSIDTMVAVRQYPELCIKSDYCAMNCHAFFDGGRTADEAGAFVDMFVSIIKAATGKDKIVITETGWPTCGANGVAIGSESQQAIAVKMLKAISSTDIIIFSGYNELWKTDTTGTEHCWGQAGNGNGS